MAEIIGPRDNLGTVAQDLRGLPPLPPGIPPGFESQRPGFEFQRPLPPGFEFQGPGFEFQIPEKGSQGGVPSPFGDRPLPPGIPSLDRVTGAQIRGAPTGRIDFSDPISEQLAAQIGPGGSVAPGVSGLGGIAAIQRAMIPSMAAIPDPSRVADWFLRIVRDPTGWILHAPQPEVTQPRNALGQRPFGVPGGSVGDWFVFENLRTGELIRVPRPGSQQPGGGDGGGGGGGGAPPGGGGGGAPSGGGGGGTPSQVVQRGSAVSDPFIGGQVVGITAGPGENVVLDLTNQVRGVSGRTPDVSGRNVNRTVVTPRRRRRGQVAGSQSANVTQSGSAQSAPFTAGQVYRG